MAKLRITSRSTALISFLLLLPFSVSADTIKSSDIYVVDGDTIEALSKRIGWWASMHQSSATMRIAALRGCSPLEPHRGSGR